MLKVLAFLTKRKGLETRELIDYYENHHVPFVLSLVSANPLVYKRNYLVRGDEFSLASTRGGGADRNSRHSSRSDRDDSLS